MAKPIRLYENLFYVIEYNELWNSGFLEQYPDLDRDEVDSLILSKLVETM